MQEAHLLFWNIIVPLNIKIRILNKIKAGLFTFKMYKIGSYTQNNS